MSQSRNPQAKTSSPAPDLERGDEVYFRHAKGCATGKVLAHGKHGATVEVNGKRRKVRHEHVVGHKVRVQPALQVVDEGEDGFLAVDATGRKRFISDPVPAQPMRKSMPAVLLFTTSSDLAKAIKGRPGLTLQSVTDKGGNQTKRWKRSGGESGPAGGAAEAGAASGFGTHNLEAGDEIDFAAGDFTGHGTIVGVPGKDGAHVVDSSGRQHQVHWSEVTGHRAKPGTEKPHYESSDPGDQSGIEPDKFDAAEFAKSHDAPDVTVEGILASFPPDTVEKMKAVQERLATIEQTIDAHKQDGGYSKERLAKHSEILSRIITPELMSAALPADGQAPTFTILGGRGGSGKGWFRGKVYDPAKAVVIDPDEIKGMLPEYEGWNAHQVHEESGDIAEQALAFAKMLGLNVVLDGTLKSQASALARVKEFKGDGYRVEAHYMHLPRQEAAKRAVARFLGKTQRYVPVEVVLGNISNEETFDEVRKLADAWSFRDNNVPQGEQPVLISESRT